MQFHFNLASRSYLDRRTVRRWLLLVGGIAVLLLVLNMGYGYFNLQQLRQVDAHLAELDAKLKTQRGETMVTYTPADLARVMAQIEAANQIIAADRFRWTSLLGRLEQLLPDEVAVRSLTPNYRDRSLQISAVAIDTTAMTELLDNLLSSSDLNQVSLLNQAPVSQQDSEAGMQFSLVIREAF
jgi:type IV pilus assembly protein PilN